MGFELPYLKYLVKPNDNEKKYKFPTFEFTVEEYDENDESLQFMDKFTEKILSIFGDQIAKIIYKLKMENLFKGFVKMSDNKIYAFFDATYFGATHFDATYFGATHFDATYSKYKWAAMHELYNLRTLGNIPIDHSIEKMLYKNNYLIHVRDYYTEQHIIMPYVFFLCQKTSSSFFSFVSNDIESYTNLLLPPSTSVKDENAIASILPRVEIPDIGDYFLFTSEPLTKGENVRRFTVFVDEKKTLFLKKGQPFPKEKEDLDIEIEEETISKYSFIYFYIGETQYWAVKNRSAIIEL